MEGYVYLIGSPTFGWYKIGKSKTPKVRVNNLGILLPFKLHIIGVWKAANYHELEKLLHNTYNENRINGEWFEFTRKEAFLLFSSLPQEARIHPIENIVSSFDCFSNIDEDTRNSKKVIGVRVQKLRGNFTEAEREERRIAAIAKQKEKKELKNNIVQ